MDYGAFLCIFYAAAPFLAMTREVLMNRRRWFTWALIVLGAAFSIMVCVTYMLTKASDALCFNYQDVIRRLWQCTGTAGLDDTCCRRIEKDVSFTCGWNYSRAEFCQQFGEATLEYCRVNYCPNEFSNSMSPALPPNGNYPLVLDS